MCARWRVLASAVALTGSLAPAASAQTAAAESPVPVSVYGMVPREGTGIGGLSAAEQAAPAAVVRRQGAKRGEFVIAPLPMVNPTLENGLSLVVGYLYRLDVNDSVTAPS